MKLEFSKEGLLPEEILERIRGCPTKSGWTYTNAPGASPDEKGTKQSVVHDPGTNPEYCFVLDSFAPELMRGVVYRKKRNLEVRGKKILKCPYCGKTFDAVDKEIKVELRCYKHGSDVPPKEFSWCRECHGKVGIIYKSA